MENENIIISRQEGERESFLFYKKVKPIPKIGDILIVASHNYYYYLLIYKVTKEGKNNYKYFGNVLKDIWNNGCGISPSLIKSRDHLRMTTQKLVIDPKNTNICLLEIKDY